MTLAECEAEKEVRYSWSALVQPEGWSRVPLVTLSLSCPAAEAPGGSSQVREAVFKRLSLYQVLHSYLLLDDITA